MKTARNALAIIAGIFFGAAVGVAAMFAWIANGRLEDDDDWDPWDDDIHDLLSIDDEEFGDIAYDPIDAFFDDGDAWDDGVH